MKRWQWPLNKRPKKMINLEIDGKQVQVENGATVMEAASKLGVFVPHFCYHKKLSIAANCRMCLVQVEKAPNLVRRAQEPAANVGRCRVIELQPNVYADTLYNLHQDDNNRLNPDGTGWVVRGFFNLTDDKDSYFVLRENRTDPSVEYRIALPAGSQLIIDTQRLWHAATHVGSEPRYCLITSWESGPALDAYIAKHNGVSRVPNVEVPQDMLDAGQAEQARRIAARAAFYAAKGQAEKTAMSEA